MAKIVWTSEAIANLELIRGYIQQFDPQAARRLADRLVAASNSLTTFPERGRPAANGCREFVTIRPYVIRYAFADGIINILGIRHAAQLSDLD